MEKMLKYMIVILVIMIILAGIADKLTSMSDKFSYILTVNDSLIKFEKDECGYVIWVNGEKFVNPKESKDLKVKDVIVTLLPNSILEVTYEKRFIDIMPLQKGEKKFKTNRMLGDIPYRTTEFEFDEPTRDYLFYSSNFCVWATVPVKEVEMPEVFREALLTFEERS